MRGKLAALVAEKKRREVEVVRAYKPHPAQQAFHESDVIRKLARFGNRTGKTTMGLIEDAWWLTGTHPFREVPQPCRLLLIAKDKDMLGTLCRMLFVSAELRTDSMGKGNVIRQPIIPPRWIGRRKDGGRNISFEDKRQYVVKYAKFINGSELICRTVEQGREKMQGDKWHAVHWDEYGEDESLYGEITRGLIDYEGSLWITATPLGGTDYIFNLSDAAGRVYDFITDKNGKITEPFGGSEDVHEFRAETYDNPYLSKKAIDAAVANWDNTEREARLKGDFLALTEQIYPMFDDENTCEYKDVPKAGTRYIGVDPGFHHEAAVVWGIMGEDGRFYLYRELYKRHLSIAALARLIVQETGNEPIEAIFIDPASKARRMESTKSQRQLLMEEFIRLGFKVRRSIMPIAVSNERDFGIAQVRHWLAGHTDADSGDYHPPALAVCRDTMPHWIAEVKRYRKRPDSKYAGGEKVIAKRDHLMDATRYLIVGNPVYIPPTRGVPMTEEQKRIRDASEKVVKSYEKFKDDKEQREAEREQAYYDSVLTEENLVRG